MNERMVRQTSGDARSVQTRLGGPDRAGPENLQTLRARCDLKELTSMALDPQKLDEIIRSGDVAACVAFFRGASEAERKKVAKVAVNHLRELTTRTSMPARLLGSLARTQIGPASAILTQVDGLGPAAFQVIRVAVLASAPLSKWRSLGLEGMPPELVDAILTDRRPPWLVEAIDLLMGLRPPFNTDYWPIVRRMIRDGLCQAPTSTTYLETMIATLPATSCERKEDLKTLLLEDPGLLDHEIWRIFESEPRPGSIQLLSYYNSGDLLRHSWEHALVELARDGTIPRARLLDATLDGLERDFHDQRARWFAALHERLDPTTSEQAGFVGRYLALLGSRNPSTVNFALAVAKHLDTAEQLDPAVLIASITPALRARTIRTVNLALELLDLATRRAATSPARSQAALVAVEALVHEAPGVQRTVLELIERHGDPGDLTLRELLVDRIEAVAPSLRESLHSWLGKASGPMLTNAANPADVDALIARAIALEPRWAKLAGVPTALDCLQTGGDVPALDFDGTEIPRLDPARAIAPIVDLDELIDVFATVIEGQGSPDDFERVLDGVSRLCDQRPDDFTRRTAPLARRSQNLIELWKRQAIYANVPARISSGLVVSWVSGEILEWLEGERNILGLFARRVRSISRRMVARQAAPLFERTDPRGRMDRSASARRASPAPLPRSVCR